MIYQMCLEKDGIYLFLAAGSEQNLKPDLVIRAFLDFINEDHNSVSFHYHRIDVYARQPEDIEYTCQSSKKFIQNGKTCTFIPLSELRLT